MNNYPFRATYPVQMRILMSGASGLIGSALNSRLIADGHSVTRLVRREANAGEVRWDPVAGSLDPAAFDGCDAVINLSGAGIGDKRWTDDYNSVSHPDETRGGCRDRSGSYAAVREYA